VSVLEFYGFGMARDYPPPYEGEEYDSKATAGVAYGDDIETDRLEPGPLPLRGRPYGKLFRLGPRRKCRSRVSATPIHRRRSR
jgi:hypothetical protein